MEVVKDLMLQQTLFEASIVGTDGDLSKLNTPEYALVRGVIGEAEEALEAIREGDIQAAKWEMADVLVFLCTAFNQLGMTYEEVCELASAKMEVNRIKYYSDGEALPVAEIMIKRKREWNEIVVYDSELINS